MAAAPNILMLVVDSLDGRLLDEGSHVYGEVALPRLRALAAESVNFVRAYSPNPVCVPARVALLTGRLPHALHVYSNTDGLVAAADGSLDARCVRLHGAPWCERLGAVQRGVRTLPAEMTSHGYEVRTYGKLDVGGVCSDNVPCDPAHNESGWNGFHVNPKEHWCTLVRAAGVRRAQTALPTPQPGEPSEQVDFKRDEETVHLCVRALRQHQHARQRRRRLSPPPPQPVGGAVKALPLFLYCDIDYPHGPFWRDMPAAALAAVNMSALGLPPHHVPLGDMHPYDAAMSVARGLQHPPPSAEAAAAFRLAHFAKLAQTDAMVGRILDAAASTLRSTLVVLTSDHGEMVRGRGRGRGRLTSPATMV
jgi:arylsulfatase A-like enzyme